MKLFARKSITDWVTKARGENALLLDVRTPEEFAQGHIPGSRNLPLSQAGAIGQIASDREQSLYVCCRSGARSAQACALFQRMGYKNVTNIGGILSWPGEIEEGESA